MTNFERTSWKWTERRGHVVVTEEHSSGLAAYCDVSFLRTCGGGWPSFYLYFFLPCIYIYFHFLCCFVKRRVVNARPRAMRDADDRSLCDVVVCCHGVCSSNSLFFFKNCSCPKTYAILSNQRKRPCLTVVAASISRMSEPQRHVLFFSALRPGMFLLFVDLWLNFFWNDKKIKSVRS